jgi:hypothetical protein
MPWSSITAMHDSVSFARVIDISLGGIQGTSREGISGREKVMKKLPG